MILLYTPGAVGHFLLAGQAVCSNIRLMMLVLGFTVGASVLIAKAGCVAGDVYATNPCIKVLDPKIQRVFPASWSLESLSDLEEVRKGDCFSPPEATEQICAQTRLPPGRDTFLQAGGGGGVSPQCATLREADRPADSRRAQHLAPFSVPAASFNLPLRLVPICWRL